MILPDRWKNSRLIMPIGMLCLASSLALPWFVHPVSAAARKWTDGLRGLLLGLAIALNLLAVRRKARQRRCE
jgi:hypothetical protein